MTDRTETSEPYPEQLRRWARALAAGRADDLGTALADGSSPAHVKLFTESNRTKREEQLRMQLDFVAGALAGFEHLLGAYLGEEPPAAGDTTADAARFLGWVERTCNSPPEQRDHVACQRARHAVEAAAKRNRAGHLRFQELWSGAARLADEIDRAPGLRVHLNPIRVWSRFTTPALLDDDAALPADVLFFVARDTIRTAVLEAHGRILVEELASRGPCTLDQWAGLSRHADREGLVELCRDLAEMGLVAFAPIATRPAGSTCCTSTPSYTLRGQE